SPSRFLPKPTLKSSSLPAIPRRRRPPPPSGCSGDTLPSFPASISSPNRLPQPFLPRNRFASFRSPGHFRAQFPSTLRMATSSRPAKRPRQTIDLHALRPSPVPEDVQERCFNFSEPRFIN
ncbi:hypothetical protein LINGRAPRIM_LOCUS226, partial [Linum grandiflorum]